MSEITESGNKEIITSNGDEISRIVKKSLSELESILDIETPDVITKEVLKLLSIKKDAALGLINAGLKADENRFRRENKDIIERLYEKMKNRGKIIEGAARTVEPDGKNN